MGADALSAGSVKTGANADPGTGANADLVAGASAAAGVGVKA